MDYTEFFKIWVENEIVFTEYPSNGIVTLDLAKKGVEERLKFSAGITRPIIADVRNLKEIEIDARNFLASEEAMKFISAIAIVRGTPIQNLIANFYLRFDKPSVPTRLFSSMEKALRWVELYKSKTLN